MKKFMMMSIVTLGLGFAASVAFAGAEKTVQGNCRVGADAYEDWTVATFFSYDDNAECPQIKQRALIRCWGSNYTSTSAMTAKNAIVRQWPDCDAVQTITSGYNASGGLLGSVEFIQ